MSKHRLLQIALLLASAALCAALGEWLWRAAVRQRYLADRFAALLPECAAVDGDELYDLAPNLDRTHTIPDPAGGPPTVVRYRTNEARLPLPVDWPPPPDDGRRCVLFVGDSYTFGAAVPAGGSYVLQTAAALAARGAPIRAINAGVPGYNSEQELAHLRRLLPLCAPRHVVVGFVLNDAEPPVASTPPPETTYAGVWSWLLADAGLFVNALTMSLVDDRPPCEPRRRQYCGDYRLSWGPGSAKARDCRAAVLAMHAECTARGIGFTLAILPDFTKDLDDTYPYAAIHEQVGAWGREAGFVVVDTLAGLRGADAKTLRVPGDGHPTVEGHRRMAEQIAARLAEQFRG